MRMVGKIITNKFINSDIISSQYCDDNYSFFINETKRD